MDAKWWDTHIAEVRACFTGELLSTTNQARRHGIAAMGTYGVGFDPCGNSGAGCIAVAHLMGARRMLLLGYDCQRTDGKAHWHGDHPRGLGNAGSLHKWPKQYEDLARKVSGSTVINCSRATALQCFPRQPLEQALS